ncbi:hypothetical protein [Thermoanaerobacterium sp. RBIITD]|uniref:hypothetical protein n=1 Tax=Thermoanaerobacterium sp. RBIITD TaxID=1550240 RepID=UPI000BB9091D|nr:hypothetical protein [Thermoanaerobacterium sp. RBIITD]
MEKYLNKFAIDRMYLKDKHELQIIKNKYDNEQDKVVSSLLWEGIMGGNLDELVNLKIEDINFYYNTIYVSGYHKRIIETITSIYNAIKEIFYIRKSQVGTESKMLPLITPFKIISKKSNYITIIYYI